MICNLILGLWLKCLHWIHFVFSSVLVVWFSFTSNENSLFETNFCNISQLTKVTLLSFRWTEKGNTDSYSWLWWTCQNKLHGWCMPCGLSTLIQTSQQCKVDKKFAYNSTGVLKALLPLIFWGHSEFWRPR